jgi:hypothetical protein
MAFPIYGGHGHERFSAAHERPLLALCSERDTQRRGTLQHAPLKFVHFAPSGVSVRIRNVSGKKIVGLTFNAALRDAAQHWKWYHWYFDDNRPIREFGWNKVIKEGAAKTLSWDRPDIDFEHGGGGAFVLTSALFEDGSI